jgi:hypothetical protein
VNSHERKRQKLCAVDLTEDRNPDEMLGGGVVSHMDSRFAMSDERLGTELKDQIFHSLMEINGAVVELSDRSGVFESLQEMAL